MSDNVDAYATARANLRDNVKTMSTILAGTAGAVLAGSPFSGIGSLAPLSLRFGVAICGLLAVAVCLFRGWQRLTFMLRPDVLNTDILQDSFTDAQFATLGLSKLETKELVDVKAEFMKAKRALLPANQSSYEQFEAYLDTEWLKLRKAERAASETNLTDDQRKQAATEAETLRRNFLAYEQNMRDIGYWASFTRLRTRVEQGLKRIQVLGVVSLLALVAFAWAANPPKKDSAEPAKPMVIHIVSPCASCPAGLAPSTSSKVTFANGSHDLDSAAFTVINDVVATLRQKPASAVLLRAQTDTLASIKLNQALAARRAKAVRQALQDQGGVAPTRIFVSELPETALPVVTADGTSKPANRSVELVVVPLASPF